MNFSNMRKLFNNNFYLLCNKTDCNVNMCWLIISPILFDRPFSGLYSWSSVQKKNWKKEREKGNWKNMLENIRGVNNRVNFCTALKTIFKKFSRHYCCSPVVLNLQLYANIEGTVTHWYVIVLRIWRSEVLFIKSEMMKDIWDSKHIMLHTLNRGKWATPKSTPC